MMSDQKPERRTVFHSFRDAFRGIWECLKLERNMRFHLVACGYVLFFAFRLGLSRTEMAVLGLTIGAVMSAEAMNTAVEKLCDFNQKHLNPHIRVVKDAAAGAVLLCALAAALVGAFLLLRPALWTCFLELCGRPLPLVLFLLSAAAALVFVFAGPVKLGEWLSGKQRKNKK